MGWWNFLQRQVRVWFLYPVDTGVRHLSQVFRQGISSCDLSSICCHFSAEFRLGCNLPAHLQMVTKITANGDGSQEIKTRLLLGRKAMTNLDSIPKSRDINFAKRGPSSQSSGFSSLHVWMWELSMYGCERKPSAKELMLLNCGVGEDPWEPLGLQGDPTSPS